jgi:hypothetical protein
MKEAFYNWVFHFNPYTNQWAAIPRELYNDYWSNYELEGIIRSSKFSTLLDIIQKTEGDDIEKKLNIEL